MRECIVRKARLLSPEEIPDTYGKRAVWIEMRGSLPLVALFRYLEKGKLSFVISAYPARIALDRSRYRISWRVWDRPPAREDMLLERWIDDPVK